MTDIVDNDMGCVPGTRRTINSSGTGFGGAISFGRYTARAILAREDWDA